MIPEWRDLNYEERLKARGHIEEDIRLKFLGY